MRISARRFTSLGLLFAALLLITAGIAAPAGARPTSFTPVLAFQWSGGGQGGDQRCSEPFTLSGGQQALSVYSLAWAGPGAAPLAGWWVQAIGDTRVIPAGYEGDLPYVGGFRAYYPMQMGESSITTYLPAGRYVVCSDTFDCSWSLAMWEQRLSLDVASFSPAAAPVGAKVTITGSAFDGATQVVFNGCVTTNFTVDSATQITAVVPKGATSGPIGVTTPTDAAVSADHFTVLTAAVVAQPGVAPALHLRGLKGGCLKLGQSVSVTGSAAGLAGRMVVLSAQRQAGSDWLACGTSSASGSIAWTFRPAKAGTYRVRATIAGTATTAAASTKWVAFKVR
jgi:hypothetical protein